MDRDDIWLAAISYQVCCWLVVAGSGVGGALFGAIVVREYTDHWYTGLPLWLITAPIAFSLIFFPSILPIHAMGAVIRIAKNMPELDDD